jgi:hypothetical protein
MATKMSAGVIDSAFGWLGSVMHVAGSWLPHSIKVPATHRAVKFVRGWKVVVLPPGFYFYIPSMTDFIVYPVVEQTDHLPVQCGCTADKVAVAIGGMVAYRVENIELALTACWEVSHVIEDRSNAILHQFISEHNFEQILGGDGDDDDDDPSFDALEGDVAAPEPADVSVASPSVIKRMRKSGRHRVNTALTRRLRSCLRGYGIWVIRAQLTYFSPATTLCHVGNGLQSSHVAAASAPAATE